MVRPTAGFWITVATVCGGLFVALTPDSSFVCRSAYGVMGSLPPKLAGEREDSYRQRITERYGIAGEQALSALSDQNAKWEQASHVLVVETVALGPYTPVAGWSGPAYTIVSVRHWLKGRGSATRLRVDNVGSLCGFPSGSSNRVGEIRITFATNGRASNDSVALSRIRSPYLIRALRELGIAIPPEVRMEPFEHGGGILKK
jgi:hypothetical protein